MLTAITHEVVKHVEGLDGRSEVTIDEEPRAVAHHFSGRVERVAAENGFLARRVFHDTVCEQHKFLKAEAEQKHKP